MNYSHFHCRVENLWYMDREISKFAHNHWQWPFPKQPIIPLSPIQVLVEDCLTTKRQLSSKLHPGQSIHSKHCMDNFGLQHTHLHRTACHYQHTTGGYDLHPTSSHFRKLLLWHKLGYFIYRKVLVKSRKTWKQMLNEPWIDVLWWVLLLSKATLSSALRCPQAGAFQLHCHFITSDLWCLAK